MPVAAMAEVMAEIAAMGVGMLSNMPVAMLKVDTLVFVPAVDAVTRLRGPRGARLGLQDAHAIGMAVATGEAVIGEAVTGDAVTGEVITGIRPMDIPGSAITGQAMAIHTTVRITTDIILTATASGRP